MPDADRIEIKMKSPAAQFDHHSPDYAAQSWEINRALRQQCPVAHSEAHGGFWIASSHAAVTTAAMDDATYSSDHDSTGERLGQIRKGILLPEKAPFRQIPIEMDPPESMAYKRLLLQDFSPAKVAKMRDQVGLWVTSCLDRVIETGEMDIIRDLASPVPALIAAYFLGLPLEDWRKYAAPTHKIIYAVPGSPDYEDGFAGLLWIDKELHRLVADRRANPVGDIITKLTQAEVNGKKLPDDEIVAMLSLVIQGGFDTTGALIAGAMLWMSEHPEGKRQLIENRALLPAAGEEFLRYVSPTQVLSRTVTRDAELGGQQLKAGEQILLSWASANQDETVYDHPEEVRFDRPRNNHYAFGVGHHTCMGASIVRMQWPVVMNAILDRIPDFKIDRARSEPYTSKGTVNGWISMRATFTPGTKIASNAELEELIGRD